LAWGSDDITAYRACGEKGIAHVNKAIFNYRSNGLSITSTGNIILKLRANIEYSKWVCKYLINDVPKESDALISGDVLLRDCDYLLRKRNINAMSKAVTGNLIHNLTVLLMNYRRYDVSHADMLKIVGISIRRKLFRP
jgi:hypothetical protein